MEKKQGNLNFSFIDLFAGIGGMRIPFEKIGGVCVFSSEYDRFCQKTYQANFNDVPEGDIRRIDEKTMPDHDILLAGFPCQPFSIAGVSKKLSLGEKHGFRDKKQGNLFFHIARIIKYKKPKAFLLENVKNLRNHDKGRTYRIIENTLKDLDYDIFAKVIDAVYYVPQHRERIFIVGFRKDLFPDISFFFPEYPRKRRINLADIIDSSADRKYTISDKLWAYLQKYALKHKEKGNGFGFGLVRPAKDDKTRTLSARYYKDGSEILIKQTGRNPRRLTLRECALLMGFPKNFIIPVSDTQAYRQFGNAVVVPVVSSIAKKMMAVFNDYHGQDIKRAKKPEHVPHREYKYSS